MQIQSLWRWSQDRKRLVKHFNSFYLLLFYLGNVLSIFVSSANHRHYEKTLNSSGKCFIYGKLLRHTNKVSLRFLLRDTLHEAFFIGYQEGNIVDNHS